MKRSSCFVLFTLIFLTACSNIPGIGATATSTPAPTFTPHPSETPTQISTATPNASATAAVQATKATDDMLSDLDRLLGDTNIPYRDGYLAWKYDDPVTIKMNGPESSLVEIDNRLTAGNFILKSDVTWSATGIIICGAIFRSEKDLTTGSQYQFLFLRLSGLPAWAIEFHEFGYYKNSPTKTQYSSALLQENGATNEFILVAEDEEFTLYINRVRQGRYFDNSKQRVDGAFAFLGIQDSGKGSCKYENSWIWSLDPNTNGPTAWSGN